MPELDRLFAVALAVSLAACGGDDGDGDPGADGGGGGIDISGLMHTPCPANTAVDGFTVELADAFTSVRGGVYDGTRTQTVPEVLVTEGDCRLLGAPTLFCDPACGTGMECNAQGTCEAQKTRQDVGTVTVEGLVDPVSMTPTPPGNAYNFSGTLTHPGFATGDPIRLSTSGATYGPFTLLGVGIDALDVPPAPIAVAEMQASTVTWTAPTEATVARVKLTLNVNRHGLGAGVSIECDVPDTGSFSIPEPLITTMVADGLSGFPSIDMVRSSIDSTTIESGCVEFRVQSVTNAEVAIDGLTSCSDNDDCTMPETCQPDLTCG